VPEIVRRSATELTRALIPSALLALATARAEAADHGFLFWSQAAVTRDGNVLRTGGESQSDYITRLTMSLGWSAETPRSITAVNYIPAYFDYAEFDPLDNLEHRMEANWKFTPGPRSTFLIGQSYLRTEQQSGFQDFVNGPADPIVERTLREIVTLVPSYILEATPDWTLTATGTARAEYFDSETLVDTEQYGFEFEALHASADEGALGGRLRGDQFDIVDPGGGVPTGPDRFITGDAIWSGRRGPAFTWYASAGAFWGSGGDLDTIVKPTSALRLNWAGRTNTLTTGYDLGFSSSGGLGGVSRSLFGEVAYAHRFGPAMTATVRGSRIRLEDLPGLSATPAELDGWQADYGLSYQWRTGVGISGTHRFIQQDSTNEERLEYQELSLMLSYTPDKGGTRPERAHPGN
jgi:hypothetical protein